MNKFKMSIFARFLLRKGLTGDSQRREMDIGRHPPTHGNTPLDALINP